MPRLGEWLRKASTAVLDPGREARLQHYVREFAREIKAQGSRFSFAQALREGAVSAADTPLLREKLYEASLRHAWQDRQVTDREKAGLQWLKKLIEMPDEQACEVEMRIGRDILEQCLADAITDGNLSESESTQLQAIATTLNVQLGPFIENYFSNWSEGFLRGLFASSVENGTLTRDEWAKLIRSAERLGLGEKHLVKAVNAQAKLFVEHTLADAKSDGTMTPREAQYLEELTELFHLDSKFRDYVNSEVEQLRSATLIMEGVLPSLAIDHVALKAGEIVHFCAPAVYRQIKHLASGTKTDESDGQMYITDHRLLFDSSRKSFAISLGRIVGIDDSHGWLELRSATKGTGYYAFPTGVRHASLILRAAVKKANQTLVDQREGQPTRHIPRDVRQRIWQKYSGRCAECSAADYLEFDHIVPVAKGGSNTDNNVQLLCRRCNLKKSDNI